MTATPTDARAVPCSVPIQSWELRSSQPFPGEPPLETGENISQPGYDATGWLVAPRRSTVLAALTAAGRFPAIERSTNLRDLVDAAQFQVPWWYRTTFVLEGEAATALELRGLIQRGELYVNGARVAGSDELSGAYSVSEHDVSRLVRPGLNALALRVHPGNPLEDLSIGWIDWNQWPPDNNLGVWRDVLVVRSGPLRLGPPAVHSELELPAFGSARLTVAVEVLNRSDRELSATLAAQLTGPETSRRFTQALQLAAGECVLARLEPDAHEALVLERPAVWWPVGEGDQPLYDLALSVTSAGELSDRCGVRFGIRSVSSHLEPGGGRRFVVNGRPLQIVSGGWSPDLFLRSDHGRLASELEYAIDLGCNAIRLEGKLDNPELYELTDELGLMVLPGWECCTKWESEKRPEGTAWTDEDDEVARRSMASEAVLLRNHPSVIAFLIGSDYAPPEDTARMYVEELHEAEWDLPIVSSARAEGTEVAGPSGMKMTGPYDWVPPVYWYSSEERFGGAVGFNSETGAGSNLPRLVNLRRMLSDEELESLWRDPDAKQFHAAPPSVFDNLGIFHRALAARYGEATSLEDFLRKAQLANYEAVRAQFEAYRSRAFADRPATGVVYWMLNSAWPSLNWQLYDWYLDPGAAYFAAKKANSPLHAFYDYATGSVLVRNRRREATGPLELSTVVRSLGGAPVTTRSLELEPLAPGELRELGPEVGPAGEPTYFLELALAEPQAEPSERRGLRRNVYWLSSTPDVPDWEATTWQYTPCSSYADLRGLAQLPSADLEVHVEPLPTRAGRAGARVRIANTSPDGTPALGVHASVVAHTGGAELLVAPLRWSDNDVCLFAGEEETLTVSYPASVGAAAVEVEGFNLAERLRSS